nr:zinc ribbon domain-containing protein [Streptomyces sp. H34-S4]
MLLRACDIGEFLECKAARAGVALVYVDPAYTSRQCRCAGARPR